MAGYLQLAKVREIVEVSDFLVAGQQAAAGDVGEGGGDVGKGGEAVHPRGTHLDMRKAGSKEVSLTPSLGTAIVYSELSKCSRKKGPRDSSSFLMDISSITAVMLAKKSK